MKLTLTQQKVLTQMHKKLEQFITEHTQLINETLHQFIENNDTPNSLQSSMAYSVNAGGKRIRPLLILATLEDLGAQSKDALKVACAVEFLHAYSLIHDDLPCMDDDDYRRGKKTNHKVYGEAIAVLAGDALQTLAFELLTDLSSTSSEVALKLVRLLSIAAGANGMVAGQVLDIEGEEKELTLHELQMVHLNKTGALLSFCIEAGAVLAEVDETKRTHLLTYAENIGLAFQIQDDILDVTSTTQELGKEVGSDETKQKTTYPSLLGLEGARVQLNHHHKLAKQSLAFLEDENSLLSMFADYIVERTF